MTSHAGVPERATDPLRVLVVDDNDVDVELITENLNAGWGSHVRIERARTGSEAKASLDRAAFDVCVLDYHLGDESGIDLLRELRARGHDVPVVVLTADATHDIDIAAGEAGADDHLSMSRRSRRARSRCGRRAPISWRSRRASSNSTRPWPMRSTSRCRSRASGPLGSPSIASASSRSS